MSPLLRLIAMLAGQSLQRSARRAARISALLALAMLFVMIGMTGFAVAVFILLARISDPLLAALLIGSLCCMIAALLLLAARAQTRPAAPLESADLSALLTDATKSGIWLPLVLALVAGLAVTSRRN